MNQQTGREEYKLASVGLFFLLLQIIVVAIALLVVAASIATQNRGLLAIVMASLLFIVMPIVLFGTVGKLLCLIAPSSPVGRLLIGLSLVGDAVPVVAAIGLLPVPSSVQPALTGLPFLLLLLYLATLANVLNRPDIRKVPLAALICLFISQLLIGAAADLLVDEMMRMGAMAIGACLSLYGLLLYIRSLTYLQRAISRQEPIDSIRTDDAETLEAIPEA